MSTAAFLAFLRCCVSHTRVLWGDGGSCCALPIQTQHSQDAET